MLTPIILRAGSTMQVMTCAMIANKLVIHLD